ncbi:MAG: formyltetrahydrofolate deformylase [Glaciecola sp.]|uniref:formyltetrahydrofolate deformylase n=1 Tax=Congregibacter sp. TaxID=2744308 RepID=UPI0039E3DD7D
MSDSAQSYILTFSCPDSIGVVARYSNLFYECGINITEISNYTDPVTNTFFLRCVFDVSGMSCSLEQFKARLLPVADDLQMEYSLRCATALPKVVIAVSRYDHCLTALLTKQRAGALPADIVAVLSNHEDCRALSQWHGIPFHHLPITRETKPTQEQKLLSILKDCEADLLVLARYMQILSDDLCAQLSGRAINIHHSFLPGFKGAKPYHQAYDRGVKVIGATAHYVTADLDEGPIIAQEVRPIDHEISVEQMVHLGHDTEATALSQAVRLHCEQRVILNGQRTVIL